MSTWKIDPKIAEQLKTKSPLPLVRIEKRAENNFFVNTEATGIEPRDILMNDQGIIIAISPEVQEALNLPLSSPPIHQHGASKPCCPEEANHA